MHIGVRRQRGPSTYAWDIPPAREQHITGRTTVKLLYKQTYIVRYIFYDLNLGNFVVTGSHPKSKKLFFIDLKSLHKNGYLGFLKMERYIAPLARIIMFRRIRWLYRSFGLQFPMDELCRKKMLSSFWVTIR